MVLNGFEITVIVFLAVMAAVGYMRGFTRTLIGIAMLVFSLVATVVLSSSVSEVFADSQNVNILLEGQCERYLDDLGRRLAEGEVDIPFGELMPASEEVTSALLSGGAGYLAELLMNGDFRAPIVRRMVRIAIHGIGVVVTFILVRLAFFFIGLLFRGLFGSRRPGGFDRFLGMCFAVLRGLLVIWLAMTVIRIFGFTPGGAALMSMIGESEVLSLLDEYNVVLAVLVNVLTA